MSEQQEIVSPTESASNVGKRNKARPGKAQRNAARSVTDQASSVTGATSVTNSNMFARKMSFTPTPQPGRYPIVFPSGAGEPTRDSHFAIDAEALKACFGKLGPEYIHSARYAEFSSHASYGDTEFHKDVIVSALLATAQQIVHAHQNLGLPIGDFSSIGSTDVYTMSGIRAIVRQFGEFQVESLGTRYLLYSYEDEVKALVRTAKRVVSQTSPAAVNSVLREHWLPTGPDDKRTRFIVAVKLKAYLENYNVSISMEELLTSLFSQASTVFETVKGILPEEERDLFGAFFTPFESKTSFLTKVNSNGGRVVLKEKLGLHFGGTSLNDGHLVWDVVPKITFPDLALSWLKKKNSITRFFACSSGLVEKSEATGLPNQLSVVENVSGVTIVKSLVAVSAGDFSLMACFSPSAVYPYGQELNVVLTTSIPVVTRATEFLQRDWL